MIEYHKIAASGAPESGVLPRKKSDAVIAVVAAIALAASAAAWSRFHIDGTSDAQEKTPSPAEKAETKRHSKSAPTEPASLDAQDAKDVEDLPLNPLEQEHKHLLNLLRLKPEGVLLEAAEQRALLLAMQALAEKAYEAAENGLPISAPTIVIQDFNNALASMIDAQDRISESTHRKDVKRYLDEMCDSCDSALLSNGMKSNPVLERKRDINGKKWLVRESGHGEWMTADQWSRNQVLKKIATLPQ